MNIEIREAALAEKTLLRNLLELCQHDYSEYDGEDVDEHGLFGYRYLDHYWTDAGRYPFLIRVDARLAGFVLVRVVDSKDRTQTYSIAEFFVMRKYRRHGVGRQAACFVFDRFPGPWIVCQEAGNLPAQHFWRQIIGEYTHGNFTDEQLDTDEWHGPCRRFDSSILSRARNVL